MATREFVDKAGNRYVWKDGRIRCYPAKTGKDWVKKIDNFFKTLFGKSNSLNQT